MRNRLLETIAQKHRVPVEKLRTQTECKWEALGELCLFPHKEQFSLKIWEEADKITLRDVIMAWVFVPYPLVVTSITLAICSGEGYINALYPLLGIVVIALLSLVAFPYLFHKPLKKTLCATGIWAHYLGFLLKTEGGSLPLSVAWRLFLAQDFSRSIQVAGLSIWILVMLAVAWQIIVAIYRTVRFLVKR